MNESIEKTPLTKTITTTAKTKRNIHTVAHIKKNIYKEKSDGKRVRYEVQSVYTAASA